MTAAAALAVPVMVPLLAGVLLFLAPVGWRRILGLAFAVITSLSAVPIPFLVLQHGTLHQSLGGWSAPLGIEIRADGLSAFLMLFAALMGLCVSLYSFSYFTPAERPYHGKDVFWPLWFLQWGGLNAMLLSADLFNYYVTLEVISLSSVSLLTLSGTREAANAALRYLLLAMVGSLSYLLGIGLLYNAVGALDLYVVAEAITSTPITRVGTGLMIAGLLVKCALVPLHFWLPRAHAHAPAPVSAILSGLVITAAYYLVLRIWFYVLPPLAMTHAALLLSLLGSVAILWGGWLALRQERIKMVIAYSTVSQVGYMFLVFSLSLSRVESRGLAWAGIIMFIVAQGLGKGAAFLAAGSLVAAGGGDRVVDMTGAARRYPAASLAFALAGISMMGLPPSGVFVGKWMLLKAVFLDAHWIYVLVIILGGLLACAYVFRVLERFMAAPPPEAPPPSRIPLLQLVSAMVLALAAIALGHFIAWPMAVVGVDAPVTFTEFIPSEVAP